jgi:hypothetical protein
MLLLQEMLWRYPVGRQSLGACFVARPTSTTGRSLPTTSHAPRIGAERALHLSTAHVPPPLPLCLAVQVGGVVVAPPTCTACRLHLLAHILCRCRG